MKEFIKKRFHSLYFFYQFLGFRIFILLLFSLLMVVLDSLGIAMFVPLLQIADHSQSIDATDDKVIKYTTLIFDFLHIDLTIINMLLLLVVLFGLKAVFYYYANKYLAINQQYFSREMRTRMIVGLKNISYKNFIKLDIGRLQNSLLGESWQVVFACNQYLETIKNSMFVVIYIGFAFFLDWKFSILVCIGGLISNFIYRYFYKRTERLSREITKNNHRYGGVVVEIINHYKYLKATGRNDEFFKRLQNELKDLISSGIEVAKLSAKLSAIREPITMAIICVVIAIHVLFFKSPLAAIIIILMFFYRALQKIVDLQSNWNNYLSHVGSIENMKDFQAIIDENQENFSGTKHIENINSIKLKDVDLFIDSHQVLRKVNFEIVKNTSIAIVGESGSGKTSLVNLLTTLLPISQGEILLNGVNIQEYNNGEYKSKIGYITQEPSIFNADIFDNVTFWSERSEENMQKFKRISKLSGLSDFLENLPERENTLLGNNGVNISGGQKQRISIARELFRDIEILIMDEATSALDSDTELTIKNSIEMLHGKLTIISIAHRLSTIKNVDTVYVMDKGRIVDNGGFTELKAKSNYFKRLTELQGV